MELMAEGGNTVSTFSNVLNNIGLEKLFFRTVDLLGMQDKVTLQRIEKDNNNYTVYNIIKDNNGTIDAIPCP